MTTNPLSPDARAKLIDWLNAFKADPFSTGEDKVDRLIEVAAIAAMPELSALQDKIRRLEEALKKIAKPGVGAAFDWSVEECERYWAQQTERCRSLARTALSDKGED